MEKLVNIIRDPVFLKWVYLAAALLLIYFVVKLLQRGTSKYVANNNTRYQVRKIISFAGYIVALIALMLIFNYNLSSLSLAVGVAGAGIAFALQEVIVSIAGFMAILFANFYKVGDRVQLGGIKGDVVDIGVLRTTLMEIGDWVTGDLYNGKMVRVANSFIFKEPVYNYSGDFPFLWDEMQVPVKLNSDFRLAKEILMQILEKEVGAYARSSQVAWDKMTRSLYIEKAQIDPMVTMRFDENWITFTLRYVIDYKKRRATKNTLSEKILEAFVSHKDKIEIASSAFEITAFPKNTNVSS